MNRYVESVRIIGPKFAFASGAFDSRRKPPVRQGDPQCRVSVPPPPPPPPPPDTSHFESSGCPRSSAPPKGGPLILTRLAVQFLRGHYRYNWGCLNDLIEGRSLRREVVHHAVKQIYWYNCHSRGGKAAGCSQDGCGEAAGETGLALFSVGLLLRSSLGCSE